jgi:hypothetical protein
MITIIRYRNDTYYGVEGEIEYPTVMHSGFTDEENRLMENYRKRIEEFEEIRKDAVFLNKVHAKKALDSEILNWRDKFKSELEDIEYKLNHVHGFSGFEQLWKKEYTFYHINNTLIEEMTKPTINN